MVVLAAVVAGTLGFGSTALAQEPTPGRYGYPAPPPPPRTPVRDGFVLGFSVGGGSYRLTCGELCMPFAADRYQGGSFSLHIGGMIGPASAIVFDLWAIGYSPDADRTLFHNLGVVALRHFLARRVWLQGGFGWANFSLSCSDDAVDPTCGETSKTGGALMAAAGFEVLQMTTFTVDVVARLGVGKYQDGHVNMGAVQLGFNWY